MQCDKPIWWLYKNSTQPHWEWKDCMQTPSLLLNQATRGNGTLHNGSLVLIAKKFYNCRIRLQKVKLVWENISFLFFSWLQAADRGSVWLTNALTQWPCFSLPLSPLLFGWLLVYSDQTCQEKPSNFKQTHMHLLIPASNRQRLNKSVNTELTDSHMAQQRSLLRYTIC